ncbi:MAG: hypothetical protein Q7S31_02395 [bacterium]|nr:hypothetical protein [bacterium]
MSSQEFVPTKGPGFSRGLKPAPRDTSISGEPELGRVSTEVKLLAIATTTVVATWLIWLASHPEPVWTAFR